MLYLHILQKCVPTAYCDWESCVCNCGKFILLIADSGLAGNLFLVLFVQLGVGIEGVLVVNSFCSTIH